MQIQNVLIKPYMRAIFAVVLETKDKLKGAETIVQECLKTLTVEDFSLLMYQENQLMQDALHNIGEGHKNQSNAYLESVKNPRLREGIRKVLARIYRELFTY